VGVAIQVVYVTTIATYVYDCVPSIKYYFSVGQGNLSVSWCLVVQELFYFAPTRREVGDRSYCIHKLRRTTPALMNLRLVSFGQTLDVAQ
jgi:hypothetical protein